MPSNGQILSNMSNRRDASSLFVGGETSLQIRNVEDSSNVLPISFNVSSAESSSSLGCGSISDQENGFQTAPAENAPAVNVEPPPLTSSVIATASSPGSYLSSGCSFISSRSAPEIRRTRLSVSTARATSRLLWSLRRLHSNSKGSSATSAPLFEREPKSHQVPKEHLSFQSSKKSSPSSSLIVVSPFVEASVQDTSGCEESFCCCSTEEVCEHQMMSHPNSLITRVDNGGQDFSRISASCVGDRKCEESAEFEDAARYCSEVFHHRLSRCSVPCSSGRMLTAPAVSHYSESDSVATCCCQHHGEKDGSHNNHVYFGYGLSAGIFNFASIRALFCSFSSLEWPFLNRLCRALGKVLRYIFLFAWVLPPLLSVIVLLLPELCQHLPDPAGAALRRIVAPQFYRSLPVNGHSSAGTDSLHTVLSDIAPQLDSYAAAAMRTDEVQRLRLPSHLDALWQNRTGQATLQRIRASLHEQLGLGGSSRAGSTVPTRRLNHHSLEFSRSQIIAVPTKQERILKLRPKTLFVGIGYGLANCIILNFTEGTVFVDALENSAGVQRLMDDWEKLHIDLGQVPLPPVALIYSHFHTDHVGGSRELVRRAMLLRQEFFRSQLQQTRATPLPPLSCDSDVVLNVSHEHSHGDTKGNGSKFEGPKGSHSDPCNFNVWAHQRTVDEILKVMRVTAGITFKRSARQFGTILDKHGGFLNAGIGPFLAFSHKTTVSVQMANRVWQGNSIKVSLGGMAVELHLAPGESVDQCVIWIPAIKALVGADNIYKAFPNLYAIRGTESRNALQWVQSLDEMREMGAEVLLLGHTKALEGAQQIRSTLTAYRDAIQFVHDQTVRLMNKGMGPSDLAHAVRLPPDLAEHPYLQEFYGAVPWSVRAIFSHYMGWFSGAPEDLFPLATIEKAELMSKLVGSREALLAAAWSALREGNLQWSLELVTHAHRLRRSCPKALFLRVMLLQLLAAQQVSAAGRNWYLTAAVELESEYFGHSASSSAPLDRVPTLRLAVPSKWNSSEELRTAMKVGKDQRQEVLMSLRSALDTMPFMTTRFKAEKAVGVRLTVAFTLLDTNEGNCWHIRHGVLSFSRPPCDSRGSLKLAMTSWAWRQLTTRTSSIPFLIATGQLRIRGRLMDLLKLATLFEDDD